MRKGAMTKKIDSNKKIFPVDPKTIFGKPEVSMDLYKKVVLGDTPKKKKLRRKKPLNYVEVSFESTPKAAQTLSEHVPIYLQTRPTEKTVKKDNLYDFDDDCFVKEEKRKLRKRKLSDVNEYDRAMDDVLKRIRKKMETRQNVKKKAAPKQMAEKVKKVAIVEEKVEKLVHSTSPVNFEPMEQSDNESSEEFFGFNSENEEDTRPNVVILSNQCLMTGQNLNQTDFSFSNPTNPSNCISSPWRTNLHNVTRNPHFFSYKKTLVPNYNQEMVLNSTIAEQIPKTPLQTNDNNMFQSTLLNYITTTEEEPVNNANNLSLFDINQLSPIKRPERRILLDSTKTNVPQPLTVVAPEKNQDIDNYFGFDFDSDEKENQHSKQKPKPTRINFDLVPKIIPEKKENQPQIIIQKFTKIETNIDDTPNSNLNIDYEKPILFEDLEQNHQMQVPKKIYKRKARQTCYESMYSEEEETEKTILKVKRKKKDKRTKAEEKLINTWAAECNSRFAEIDNYELEIE